MKFLSTFSLGDYWCQFSSLLICHFLKSIAWNWIFFHVLIRIWFHSGCDVSSASYFDPCSAWQRKTWLEKIARNVQAHCHCHCHCHCQPTDRLSVHHVCHTINRRYRRRKKNRTICLPSFAWKILSSAKTSYAKAVHPSSMLHGSATGNFSKAKRL